MSDNKTIFLCAICNIESGTCNEDCKFCTQSVKYKADIQRYKRKEIDQIVEEAKKAKQNHANGFCLVTAGKGLTQKRLEFVCEAVRAVKKENLGLVLIACNGTATVEQLEILKEAGIDAYNHNLETARDFYPTICTTHTWDERYETCKNVKQVGLRLICGGIFGMGETQEQRVSMLESIASLDPMNVPLNFFHPNEALPLVKNTINREQAFELITLARKMIPNARKIMVAGGRELMFGEEEYKIFEKGANAFVIGNYLTTQGKTPKDDIEALEKLGFSITREFDNK
ncbi:biotin synthase BioB [Malaciobacter molluscorum LMG 25693]|uniref:Biotin synthase n=1 Tax=Malaciobacter molluscorum LMG 25693 TaxID=870501 RepID=A0A2G1DFP8_9BACT|nr:biotin synthase [Malaciobacter molluscorum]AXX93565.1 biotin synthetase [Malaciobacter molluscorum LMG 25693]PHO17303.1 biotin synthase BioB [Malaciobacter molluscorum LMG 25693]RXJ93889.1 biotin synthase BioB [Malaciobacter molluscorum]